MAAHENGAGNVVVLSQREGDDAMYTHMCTHMYATRSERQSARESCSCAVQ